MARTPKKFNGDLKEVEEHFKKANNIDEVKEIITKETEIVFSIPKPIKETKKDTTLKVIKYDSRKNLTFEERFKEIAINKLEADKLILEPIKLELAGSLELKNRYRVMKQKDKGNIVAIEPLPTIEKIIWNEETPEETQLQFRLGEKVSTIQSIKKWENLSNARTMFKGEVLSINDKESWNKTIQYCRVIGEQMGKQYEELKFTGYQENKLILSNQEIILKDNLLLTKQNRRIRTNQSVQELDNKLDLRISNDQLTKEEKLKLKEIITTMRGTECWGTWITAVHFTVSEKIHRPPIACFGLTGKGKTDGFRMLSKVGFGIIGEEQASSLRQTVVKRYMDTTNIGMFILDDIKDDNNYIMDMDTFIRLVRDRQSLNQATVGKGFLGFELRAPLVVTGETKFSNQSTLNRLIEVDLSKQLSNELWNELQNDDSLLIKLKSQLIKYRLSKTKEEIEEKYQNQIKHLKQVAQELKEQGKQIEPRAIETQAPAMLGLEILEEILDLKDGELKFNESNFVKNLIDSSNIFEDNILNWIIDMLNMGWIRRKDELNQFNQDLQGIKMNHDIEEPIEFQIGIRISKFKELIDRLKTKNISEVELLKLNTLTKRLKVMNSPFIKYKKSIRFNEGVSAGLEITINKKFRDIYYNIVGGEE